MDEQWMDLAIEAGQLREALVTRADIEQAKGIIMSIRRCGPDDAYRELSTVSQRTNVKVARLARALVAMAKAGGEPPPSGESEIDAALMEVLSRNWSSGLRGAVPPPSGSDSARA